MTNTTKTLEERFSEWYSDNAPTFTSGDMVGSFSEKSFKAGFLIALDACREKMPQEEYVTDCEHTPNDSCDSDCANKYGAIMFNAARKSALSAIDSLRTVRGKETV